MREPIISGKIYHVLNRGVDKRTIFQDTDDYVRFMHDLFEFNDEEWVSNVRYRLMYKKLKYMDTPCPYILINQKQQKQQKQRKLLVEILAFCLMPNHYHLLIKPKNIYGLSKFMHKLNMGYAKYFNEKEKRDGALFQGEYKLVPIITNAHLIHIPYYIHSNPLDLKFPEWREGKIQNHKKAVDFLKNYRWSSFLDYIGNKNFPSIINQKFLLNFFGFKDAKEYEKQYIKWLMESNIKDEQRSDLFLES